VTARQRPPDWRTVVGWIIAPAILGLLLAANVDRSSLPFVGTEHISAVILLDGQAYFGHLDDPVWSDSVVLRDVYYFQDAHSSTTQLPLALVKRGGEAHGPADGMRIRRDQILVIERVGAGSAVAAAIAAERAIAGVSR
jgi:hypothetical protein